MIEGLNARDLTAAHVPPPDWITADLSFISLTKALPPALASPGPARPSSPWSSRSSRSAPRASARAASCATRRARAAARAGVHAFLAAAGWTSIGETESPIRGGDGNVEFLIAARNAPAEPPER